jgi:hypothetical protein
VSLNAFGEFNHAFSECNHVSGEFNQCVGFITWVSADRRLVSLISVCEFNHV